LSVLQPRSRSQREVHQLRGSRSSCHHQAADKLLWDKEVNLDLSHCCILAVAGASGTLGLLFAYVKIFQPASTEKCGFCKREGSVDKNWSRANCQVYDSRKGNIVMRNMWLCACHRGSSSHNLIGPVWDLSKLGPIVQVDKAGWRPRISIW
jgi:hypothetical protein